MRDAALKPFARLVGRWSIEATHRLMPGMTITGSATFEWLEGEKFLIERSQMNHPEFPGAIAITGFVDRDRVDAKESEGRLMRTYFDTRGIHRTFDTACDERTWRFWNEAPGFSQRFTGTFTSGDVIEGVVELREDGKTWVPDMRITFRRVSSGSEALRR